HRLGRRRLLPAGHPPDTRSPLPVACIHPRPDRGSRAAEETADPAPPVGCSLRRMSDGYTGRVVPGGPADVRELVHLAITKVSVGPHDNNAFLLRCRETGEQLLVDAPTEAGRLLEVVGGGGLATIVTTHGHADHWQALRQVAEATGARTVAHPLDA